MVDTETNEASKEKPARETVDPGGTSHQSPGVNKY